MHRTDLLHPDGNWRGLALDVRDRPRPELRLHTAGGDRLLLELAGDALLFGVVERDLGGVSFWRTDTWRPSLPPWRADTARLYAGDPARWAHAFAEHLAVSDTTPLHDGRWILTPYTELLRQWNRHGAPAGEFWGERIVEGHPDGYLDWYFHNGAWTVLPLRALPEADDARVKAYRKQVRDGTLPPVLLWWVSGLDCHLILDGHARLAAAVAENAEPPLLVLHRALPGAELAVAEEAAAADYTREMERWRALRAAHGEQVPDGTEAAGPALARALDEAATGHRPTWAWPLPGGRAEWERRARAAAPGWAEES
ncbi:hypothetical protein H9Y04_14580 [Streptomyces sp. TRM66268-LWL]|uniref:Uncharacterized protein n=1 Tax=Streptomyces polyasparticus TaxID=2767826 RepID=A0ABR7SF25_9ACTN|nr:hypothetical protein [Streptomyces polyasparticus]MBC9713794.1 hypothetical protein [Streptomyces polyasparticus]